MQVRSSGSARRSTPRHGACISSYRSLLAGDVVARMPQPQRILVADDDTMVALLIREMLQDLGHDAHVVATVPADLLTAVQRLRPDLLIIEERLSRGASGMALLRAGVRGTASLIALSDTNTVCAKPCPRVVMLDKPFGIGGLMRAIQVAAGSIVQRQCHAPSESGITRTACLGLVELACA